MKTMNLLTRLSISSALAAAMLAQPLMADEGMWLFNDPPRKQLKEKYNFEPSNEWLEHVQKSSVRFNSGGSGSFVSEDGLVMSNHHVGADCLQKLGSEQHNYYRDGFYARTLEEEKACPDLELNVLMSIEDVTERVNAAVKSGASAEDAFAARRAVMGQIEKESLEKTGLRSDVITLYQGGKYHLYRFKKYTDVRFVWAPEAQIGFFGGDPDNFEYPRFNLDAAFFRAYENGKPAKVQHYLKWSKAGAAENELVFVSGHPGATSRLQTMADLTYKRDVSFPRLLTWLNRMEVALNAWSGRSEENARRAKDMLFSVQNSRKARDGGLAGLLDPKLMAEKEAKEKKLREALAADPKLTDAKDAWKKIEDAQQKIKEVSVEYNVLEAGRGFTSRYFEIARTLLRSVEERAKPEGERLREFRESARESLEFDLFSTEPLYDDYEQLKLSIGLTYLVQELGFTNALVQKVLAGKSPRQRAAELVAGTKVKDVNARKALYQSKPEELQNINDSMIQLARLVDAEARRVRKVVETQDELKQQSYAKIANAKFVTEGTGSYPDATFTLRLSYGSVKGYEEGGKAIPFETTFEGLYQRASEHKERPPFDLPKRWVEKKGSLDLSTPYNFVATTDIIGGNSGSPVINKNAEVVGLIFDGNIYSLVLDFAYTDQIARAVSVHSSSIVEALRKVYDAAPVAEELTTGRRPASSL